MSVYEMEWQTQPHGGRKVIKGARFLLRTGGSIKGLKAWHSVGLHTALNGVGGSNSGSQLRRGSVV